MTVTLVLLLLAAPDISGLVPMHMSPYAELHMDKVSVWADVQTAQVLKAAQEANRAWLHDSPWVVILIGSSWPCWFKLAFRSSHTVKNPQLKMLLHQIVTNALNKTAKDFMKMIEP